MKPLLLFSAAFWYFSTVFCTTDEKAVVDTKVGTGTIMTMTGEEAKQHVGTLANIILNPSQTALFLNNLPEYYSVSVRKYHDQFMGKTYLECAKEIVAQLKYYYHERGGTFLDVVYTEIDKELKDWKHSNLYKDATTESNEELRDAQRMVNGYLWRILPLKLSPEPTIDSKVPDTEKKVLERGEYIDLLSLLEKERDEKLCHFVLEKNFFVYAKMDPSNLDGLVNKIYEIAAEPELATLLSEKLDFAQAIMSQTKIGLKKTIENGLPAIKFTVGREQWKIAAALFAACAPYMVPERGCYAFGSTVGMPMFWFHSRNTMRHFLKGKDSDENYVAVHFLYRLVKAGGAGSLDFICQALLFIKDVFDSAGRMKRYDNLKKKMKNASSELKKVKDAYEKVTLKSVSAYLAPFAYSLANRYVAAAFIIHILFGTVWPIMHKRLTQKYLKRYQNKLAPESSSPQKYVVFVPERVDKRLKAYEASLEEVNNNDDDVY